jgi:hypothetical protein
MRSAAALEVAVPLRVQEAVLRAQGAHARVDRLPVAPAEVDALGVGALVRLEVGGKSAASQRRNFSLVGERRNSMFENMWRTPAPPRAPAAGPGSARRP